MGASLSLIEVCGGCWWVCARGIKGIKQESSTPNSHYLSSLYFLLPLAFFAHVHIQHSTSDSNERCYFFSLFGFGSLQLFGPSFLFPVPVVVCALVLSCSSVLLFAIWFRPTHFCFLFFDIPLLVEAWDKPKRNASGETEISQSIQTKCGYGDWNDFHSHSHSWQTSATWVFCFPCFTASIMCFNLLAFLFCAETWEKRSWKSVVLWIELRWTQNG